LEFDILIPFPDRFIFFRSKTTLFVIPAKAGIQWFSGCLDSRIRGNDENLFRIGIIMDFRTGGLQIHQAWRLSATKNGLPARPESRSKVKRGNRKTGADQRVA
jgi:hypothetical protein